MSDPISDVVLKALRDEIHDLKSIGRDALGLLQDIRDEIRASREDRAGRSNGHAEPHAQGHPR